MNTNGETLPCPPRANPRSRASTTLHDPEIAQAAGRARHAGRINRRARDLERQRRSRSWTVALDLRRYRLALKNQANRVAIAPCAMVTVAATRQQFGSVAIYPQTHGLECTCKVPPEHSVRVLLSQPSVFPGQPSLSGA